MAKKKKKAAKKKTAQRKTAKRKPAKKTAKKKSAGKKAVAKKAGGKKAGGKKLAKKTRKSTPKKASVKKPSSPIETFLQVGQAAPDFELQTESGETIRLSDLRGKPVVLYFYPKDDTPGCTQQSCDFRDNFGRVKSVGAEIYGISRDDVESHAKFKNKYSLPFSLLADTSGKTTEEYGVWKEKSMYGRNYMGIERTTFIVDADGTIKKIYPKVSVTGHVDQVLKDLTGAPTDGDFIDQETIGEMQ